MTNHSYSRSPILMLEQQIASSAFALAPERSDDLMPSAPKFGLAISNDKGFSIRVNMETHEATLPVATLEYIWACAYLMWSLYQEYSAAQRRGEEQIDLSHLPAVCVAIELFNWAKSNQTTSGVELWPAHFPNPTLKVDDGVSATNELFLAAIGWIIHHEIAHVRAQHPHMHRHYAVQQELEADRMAVDWIFAECDVAEHKIKRQLGMTVALISMQLLDEMPGSDTYVGTHPPTVERIHACLERAGADADGAAFALATIALQLQLTQRDIGIELDGESIQDILYGALVTFRTSCR